ncbi:sugar nucleotide-binding protein [Bacillus sp. BHET2]|uniref:sugar nucleotide-binding protein n=1 Tax=Bacillus sp. BHET2 TaxID=2583818 RepID=UPI00110DA4A5|nr:sugar nucleotide-binding protein [Bacillus sp. BHET2]TMU87218.1 sugar nucleotide-binding protein [Bacillus sp. BHET2]
MRKLLIIGASGLVGKALWEECKDQFDVYGTYSSRPMDLPKDKQYQLEMSEIGEVTDIIQSIGPDAIVSCVRGDFDQQLEFHKKLALEVANTNCSVYYVSTANVFDGDFTKHHTEIDTPNASSPYGQFKIACETLLQQALLDRAVIIRIPQIWGRQSPRLDSIKLGIEKNQIEVYRNLECNHLSDILLARQLKYIITNQLKGIFHLGGVDMMPHDRFIQELVMNFSDKEITFTYQLLQQHPETYYFGLKSVRNELPKSLLKTNTSMIEDLVN